MWQPPAVFGMQFTLSEFSCAPRRPARTAADRMGDREGMWEGALRLGYNPLRSLHRSKISGLLQEQQQQQRGVRAGVQRASRHTSGCPPTNGMALKVKANFQGLGNRVGWYLTAAALADALGHPFVYTSWPNVVRTGYHNQGARDYDWPSIRSAIAWPPNLRFLDDEGLPSETVDAFLRGGDRAELTLNDGSKLRAEAIPFHPKPCVAHPATLL